MAKRKRLSPAMLTPDAPLAAPEVKSARPPIADVAHDAVTVGALQELSNKISDARSEGRWIERLPLEAVVSDYLVRDRIAIDPEEMETLKSSLRDNGQRTAIEVTPLGGNLYGLISGWRRLAALREIPEIDTVLAIIRQPDDAAQAYCAMVEENEIRAGLSFYERARIVVRAVEEGVYPDDKTALQGLFNAIPRAKRSKIRSFMRIVRDLDEVLAFPAAFSEHAGLALVKALDADDGLARRLRQSLTLAKPADAAAEQAVIAGLLRPVTPDAPKPGATLLQAGLEYRDQPNGGISLQGAALKDHAFRARLLDALKSLK